MSPMVCYVGKHDVQTLRHYPSMCDMWRAVFKALHLHRKYNQRHSVRVRVYKCEAKALFEQREVIRFAAGVNVIDDWFGHFQRGPPQP